MSTPLPPLKPGTLWRRLLEQTGQALRCGALQTIETQKRIVTSFGVDFILHVATRVFRKAQAASAATRRAGGAGSRFDPFLPPEKDLSVAQITDTHLAVLNKFNVIPNHLLIVTRDYEDQENLLNLRDFQALWACMAEFEGLGFYNSGRGAGSSQPHKHLQMVPTPLGGSGPPTPLDPLFDAAPPGDAVETVPGIPFRHLFSRLDRSLASDPDVAAGETFERYRNMLARLDIHPVQIGTGPRASPPYNLLVTRQWMLLVPRIREQFARISVNALGFAGSLFVRDREQLDTLLEHGPMQILREVSRRSHPADAG